MEFKLESRLLSRIPADVLVMGIFEGELPGKSVARLDKSFPQQFLRCLEQICRDEIFQGKSGQLVELPTYGQLGCKKIVLGGLGKHDRYNANATRSFAARVARRMRSSGATTSACLYLRVKEHENEHIQAAVEGWLLGSYVFSKYKTTKEEITKSSPTQITIGGTNIDNREFKYSVLAGNTIADAANLARDFINEPAAIMTPTRLSQEARRIAEESVLSLTVMDIARIEKLGMGCFIGVAKGAKEPPKFIVIKYSTAKSKKTIALVGKGITFDSGGLSLKTAQGMEHMKYDMSGAAAVIATMNVVARLKPKVNVIGVAALTENMPSGSALHPGDVLVAMNGKTVEVNNTDAEGRLILADALCYAAKQAPDEIIDIATLTGACVTALGRVAAGIMGNNEKLIDKLIAAGNSAGEKLWHLPLYDEYKETLKSDVADLKNSGSKGEAGASSAGLFLQEFVDGTPWAHVDIAGPGWLEKEKDEFNKGGTGFGVMTLCRYILSY